MTHAQRIREIRARGRIRRWEYRQRNLAHGAWLRFRTALAHAERAFRISDELYAKLVASGGQIDDRGAGLASSRVKTRFLLEDSQRQGRSLHARRPEAVREDTGFATGVVMDPTAGGVAQRGCGKHRITGGATAVPISWAGGVRAATDWRSGSTPKRTL
jgi:hypothetical protein